jgi:hypothetical protein
MGPLRLGVVTVAMLGLLCAVLVLGGNLREHVTSDRVRRAVLLHNAAVWTCVAIGVLALYAGLLITNLLVSS